MCRQQQKNTCYCWPKMNMLCDSDNNSNNNNNGGDSSSKSSDSEWLTRRSKKKNATFYVYETKIYIKRYMVCIIYRRKANSADCPLAAHSYDFSLFLSIFLQKSIFTKHTFAFPSLFFTISHSVIHILSLSLSSSWSLASHFSLSRVHKRTVAVCLSVLWANFNRIS